MGLDLSVHEGMASRSLSSEFTGCGRSVVLCDRMVLALAPEDVSDDADRDKNHGCYQDDRSNKNHLIV